MELIDNWRAYDGEVEFLVAARPPSGLLDAELASRGVALELVDFTHVVSGAPEGEGGFEGTLTDISAVSRLRELIVGFRPDVVVTNTIVAPWAALAANLEGVAHVLFAHEFGAEEHGLHFRFGAEQTFDDFARLSNLVVANSSRLRDHLAQWIPAQKLLVLHPSLGAAELREKAVARPDIPVPTGEGGLVVAAVGRIARGKGQDVLLRAVAALDAPVTVWLIGIVPADYELEFEALVDELGLRSRVVMIGAVDNPFPYIAAADVGVNASLNESFGRVTLEYMALGKPVIATDTGIATELVRPGLDGFVVPPGDAAALTVALGKYAAQDGLAREHGESARARLEEFELAHPKEHVFESIGAAAAAGPERAIVIPNAIAHWAEPGVSAIRLFEMRQHHLASQLRGSAAWRAGSLITAPARALKALVRRGRS